jgi:hypothetical protein
LVALLVVGLVASKDEWKVVVMVVTWVEMLVDEKVA